MPHIVVTGTVGGGPPQGARLGTPPNRLDIYDFVEDEKFLALYVQALRNISKRSQDDDSSFFSLGAIHGLPYRPWQGSGNKPVNPDDTEQEKGYCTHGSVLFPTWHRPYTFLFEQIIQREAIKIADTYVDHLKPQYQIAAQNLRQPYWDWAHPDRIVPPPEVISQEEITYCAPSGDLVTMPNPFRRYVFHPIDPSFPSPFNVWGTTLRHPSSASADAKDRVDDLKAQLNSSKEDVDSKTLFMLLLTRTWPEFSNHTTNDDSTIANSLESIHDGIHEDVGGGFTDNNSEGENNGVTGHMSDTSIAGFDPIFFMHHANVDRMLSLWAALHHPKWVTAGSANGGTRTIDRDSKVDRLTDLTPFWDSQTAYWKSSLVGSTSTGNYSYPEFNDIASTDPEYIRGVIYDRIIKLYGTGSLFSLERISTPSSQPKVFWEWSARVRVKAYELGQSFAVLIFLGTVPRNASEWRTSSNCVGAHHVFVNSSPEQCANCRNQREEGLVTEGFVHLTKHISTRSGLENLEPELVEPYLKKEISWRIHKTSGVGIEVTDCESLEVTIVRSRVVVPTALALGAPGTVNLPYAEDVTHCHEITAGMPGGSRP